MIQDKSLNIYFLTQIGFDDGLSGLLRQRINGIPHYLIEAKAEPENLDKI